jgi:pyridoxal phosphate enzyme (YggS family)
MTGGVAQNLEALKERIARAAGRAGRSVDEITLVAVTKQVPVERIREAVEWGVTHLGENRVQEAREKVPLVTGVTWHLVGHLQSNKARPALEMFQLIHSLDRPSLLEALSAQARKLDRVARVLIQVNTSGEATKSGVHPDRAMALVAQAQETPHVRVEGLMTIGPATGGPDAARPGFAALRQLAGQMPAASMRYLSMGMSADFEVAIEEGANLVRVGTAIFGVRPG